MKKVLTIVAYVGLLSVLVGLPSAFAGQANVTLSRTGWQPIEGVGTNNCAGEAVNFTGMLMVEDYMTSDPSGGIHHVIVLRTRGIAEGVTTGAQYVAAQEGGHLTETFTAAGAYTLTDQFRGTLISLDPNVPDLHFVLLVHITYDAKGIARVEILRFDDSCS